MCKQQLRYILYAIIFKNKKMYVTNNKYYIYLPIYYDLLKYYNN